MLPLSENSKPEELFRSLDVTGVPDTVAAGGPNYDSGATPPPPPARKGGLRRAPEANPHPSSKVGPLNLLRTRHVDDRSLEVSVQAVQKGAGAGASAFVVMRFTDMRVGRRNFHKWWVPWRETGDAQPWVCALFSCLAA